MTAEITAPFSGKYSSEEAIDDETIETHVEMYETDSKPHIYYMAILDCENNFGATFKYKNKNIPKVAVGLDMRNDDDHFSYED